jgi:hypothetical protein
MHKLLVGVVVEVFVAVLAAGLMLGLAIPALNRAGLIASGDDTVRILIIGVLVLALAIALFRPGSAIHRHIKR